MKLVTKELIEEQEGLILKLREELHEEKELLEEMYSLYKEKQQNNER